MRFASKFYENDNDINFFNCICVNIFFEACWWEVKPLTYVQVENIRSIHETLNAIAYMT